MKLTVHVRTQRGVVQAFCPDLPGCSATAPSERAAIDLLRARVDEYFTARPASLPAGTRVVHLEV
jgi:hypothetical protein